MTDNSDDRLDKIFAAARTVQSDTSGLERSFETRLMARIRERSENRSPWLSWLWRLAPVFIVIVLFIGFVSLFVIPEPSQDDFAAITNGQEEYMVTSYLTGE